MTELIIDCLPCLSRFILQHISGYINANIHSLSTQQADSSNLLRRDASVERPWDYTRGISIYVRIHVYYNTKEKGQQQT
jgi:hypothetical protein